LFYIKLLRAVEESVTSQSLLTLLASPIRVVALHLSILQVKT